MEITWTIIADSNRARVFEQRDKHLHEIEDMVNPGVRANNMRKDGDGKLHDRNERTQGHIIEPALDPADHDNELFARSVANYLDRGRHSHRYNRLRLIAAPKFLGLIRCNLNKEVQKMVEQEWPKDISMFSIHQIETYIREQGSAPS